MVMGWVDGVGDKVDKQIGFEKVCRIKQAETKQLAIDTYMKNLRDEDELKEVEALLGQIELKLKSASTSSQEISKF